MKNKNYLLISVLMILFLPFEGFEYSVNYNKVSKILREKLSLESGDNVNLIWITFIDKGRNIDLKLSHPETFLTEKALQRRMKVKPINLLCDFTDFPLNNEYLSELINSDIKIKNKSKWFNSISCYATKAEIEELINHEFVSKVDLVKSFKRSDNDIESNKSYKFFPEDNYENVFDSDSLIYGNSREQMDLINVPTAHDSGYFGQGVLVANFDTGFDNLQHPAFDSMRIRGLRTYDFVNHDTNVANEQGQMGDGAHGTLTLSLVGGYKPGNLISPAFRSTYILAKTENTDSETPLEEDNWIAAAEWADSLGADVITSSLIYLTMDSGSSHSYDWTWMNGDSCLITIGADLAVNKGIIVCNSAGNYGFHSTHNTLGAPADGDSVITVGSVNSDKKRSSFSSVGPTTDGRIKPDVVAFGNGNIAAASGAGNTGFTTGSGTSFSCPMTAGVCALILSANYNLTPMEVRQLLVLTADSSFAPNRRRGWGLINCWEAVKLAKNKVIGINSNSSLIKGYSLSQNYPNPFNPKTIINYQLSMFNFVSIKIYSILGDEVATLVNQKQNTGSYSIQFDASNLSTGIYYYVMKSGEFKDVKKMIFLK